MSDPFPFLRLPLELREQIYSLYFKPADRIHAPEFGEYGGGQYKFDFDIYRVNKQIKTEAEDVFRRENVFVRIETPWPQAASHVANEGLLPIVAADHSADIFKHATAIVQISAPLHDFTPAHTVIVLLDDLHLFCQVWFYSALNYGTLNQHLKVDFILRDPYYPADPKPIPLALQKKCLLPFGMVKGLYEVAVEGYDDSVEQELRRTMDTPYDTVQKCLEDCVALMESGDRELNAGHAEGALELYIKAFQAIHILISGRTRRVFADSYFHEGVESGRFAGQTGTTVRIILRIALVTRAVSAYLKLQQWEEAAFWGMRSIKIMREAMDTEFENFLSDFIPTNDVGTLYIRTGIAFKKMEENKSVELAIYDHDKSFASSEGLFRAAPKYFKGPCEMIVKKEFGDLGMEVPEEFVNKDKDGREGDVDSLAPMDQSAAEADIDYEVLTNGPSIVMIYELENHN